MEAGDSGQVANRVSRGQLCPFLDLGSPIFSFLFFYILASPRGM